MDWHFAPTIAYSYRLYKYSKRGFCIAAPGLDTRYTQYSYVSSIFNIHKLTIRNIICMMKCMNSLKDVLLPKERPGILLSLPFHRKLILFPGKLKYLDILLYCQKSN